MNYLNIRSVSALAILFCAFAAHAAQPAKAIPAAAVSNTVQKAGAIVEQQKNQTPAGKVEIAIKLPKPRFVGTPTSLKSARLDPKLKGKKRDPFYAPPGVKNVALDTSISASDEEPIVGELEMVTNGDKEGQDGSFVELGPGEQYVQIDLGKEYELYGIVVWHFHSMARVYRDVVIQIADDQDFIENVRTVFNNDHDNSAGKGIGKDFEYVETYEGRLIPVNAEKARYVRLYSNGSTASEMNHYTEVEVYGK